jgi:DNA-binding beta-propeller fold protein YncE
MSKKNLLFVLETVLLLVLSSSLLSCGSSRAPSQAAPRATASYRLDTGPLGLPQYCPKYVKHDQQGNLYVTDNDFGGPKVSHRARIIKLSPTGQLLAEWHVFNTFQSQPSFLGNVTGPFGIAVDASGIIYVADAGDNTIKKLSPTGQLLATWGKTGSAPGEFNSPLHGVAVDAQGNVYVTDTFRIEKFSSSGTLLAVFGNTGSPAQRLNLAAGLDIDAQGDVYVGDLRNHRLVKFSAAGRFLTAWSEAGGVQFSSAGRDVAVDRAGNIYLTDARNFRIVKFSPTGKVLAIWQRPMDLFLWGITVDPQGNIYVAMTNVPNNGGPTGGIRKLAPSGAVLATWPATCPA